MADFGYDVSNYHDVDPIFGSLTDFDASRDNPRREWYIWRDPKNGCEPNNWEAVFGGKAWQFDERTGQYYLHLFLAEQPDLNWRNPQVKEALFGECAFWLDRGVDGFRLDVAHFLVKAEGLPDNPPRFGLRSYDRQDHSHQINQPETH